MKSKKTDETYVKIQIGNEKQSSFKEFNLTRFQYDVAIVLIPVITIWGLGSTTLLFRDLISRRSTRQITEIAKPPAASINATDHIAGSAAKTEAESTVIQSKSMTSKPESTTTVEQANNTAVIASNNQSPDTVSTSVKGSKLMAANTLTINKTFLIHARIYKKSKTGPFTAVLAFENLTGKLQSGHFWAQAHAISIDGRDLWYSVTPDVTIDGDGNANNPKSGRGFSFRHFREQEMSLQGPTAEVLKFSEIIIGFERPSHEQLTGKISF